MVLPGWLAELAENIANLAQLSLVFRLNVGLSIGLKENKSVIHSFIFFISTKAADETLAYLSVQHSILAFIQKNLNPSKMHNLEAR